MAPNRKFKNHGPDVTTFVTTIVLMCFVVLCFLVLNPLHKKNIDKLKQNSYITSPWESEPKGQEYTLQDGDWVFYWKSDEKPVKAGIVCIFWGYYRIINSEEGAVEFRNIEWCNANF